MQILNQKTNKAVTTVLFVLITAFTKNYETESQSIVTQLDLIVNYPLIINKNDKLTLYNLKDTISLFFEDNCTVYKLAPKRKMYDNEKVIGSEKYLAFANNEKYGLLYNGNTVEQVIVDSILIKNAFGKLNLNIGSNAKIVEEDKRIVKYTQLERYYFNNKGDGMVDSVYYQFCPKFKRYNYSFSDSLDNLNKGKLCKVSFIYNKKYSSQYKAALPKREFSFEIRETSFSNNQKVIELFQKLHSTNSIK
jgi:hypothetical protein